MKVHRLVIIDRVVDGLHLAGSENTTTLTDALDGTCTAHEAPAIVKLLESGKPFRKEQIFAGIRTKVCLSPVGTRHRAAILQEKSQATERPMSSSSKERA